MEEVAAFNNVSIATWYRFMEANPEAAEALNAKMLEWTGKHILGQKDVIVTQTQEEQSMDLSRLSVEELELLAKIHAKASSEEPDREGAEREVA